VIQKGSHLAKAVDLKVVAVKSVVAVLAVLVVVLEAVIIAREVK